MKRGQIYYVRSNYREEGSEQRGGRPAVIVSNDKNNALKGEYDSVSDEMGSIYYKGFSEEEITRFEECLDRIRKNLEECQKS